MNVTRNVIMNPILVPGGGACEMALSHVCPTVLAKTKTFSVVVHRPLVRRQDSAIHWSITYICYNIQ
jgi:hypothetical protein